MEDQTYKETHISPEISKPSNDGPTVGFYSHSTWVKPPSNVDIWVSPSPSSGESSGFFKLLKLPDLNDTVIALDTEKFIRVARIIRSFYVDRAPLPTVWQNISTISQHEEPQPSYTVTIDEEKIVDPTTWPNVNRISRHRDFTTTDINWPRLYTAQETFQNSQKRKISERIAVFVDSIISKFDTLYQYEDPPVDDIQYTEYFIKDFASYINHDIHYIDMLDMVDVKIDEDDYISIKWKRDGRSLYFEIKDEYVYFTKLWFQDGRLISSDGTLTKEIYKETWKWIINGNL